MHQGCGILRKKADSPIMFYRLSDFGVQEVNAFASPGQGSLIAELSAKKNAMLITAAGIAGFGAALINIFIGKSRPRDQLPAAREKQ